MEISGLFFQRCMIVTNSNEIISGNPNGADVQEVSFILYITNITMTIGGMYCWIKSRIFGGLRRLKNKNGNTLVKKVTAAIIKMAINTRDNGIDVMTVTSCVIESILQWKSK